MRNLGQTNFRRPKCVVYAGEIMFRAVAYEEKSGMYIHVLTMGDITNIYRIFMEICSVATLGEKEGNRGIYDKKYLGAYDGVIAIKIFGDGIC